MQSAPLYSYDGCYCKSLLQLWNTFEYSWICWPCDHLWKHTVFFNSLFHCTCLGHAPRSWTIKVIVGQDIRIPCGVQVKGPFERLVWKSGNASSSEQLAYSYDGSISCDTQKKENCSLRSDGSLELHNVQETDSGDYFCVLDLDEKYYSQHTLVVHPEGLFCLLIWLQLWIFCGFAQMTLNHVFSCLSDILTVFSTG